MKRAFGMLWFLLWSPWALALAPYISGDRVSGGDVAQVLAAVEKKTGAAGFATLGKYQVQGLPQYAVLVVSDKGILDAIHRIGGSNIVGAGIRIGVQADGTVSYMNPDYWYRAFFRNHFTREQAAVKAVQARLGQALGAGIGFGGDERAAELPHYRYMAGMERFDSDKNELNTLPDFNTAVTTVRDNLAKGVNHTAEVYEVVMPDKKIAVFGVAMNDDNMGDGRWVYKIDGTDYIAGLPYEIYVVGNKVYALYARYRIALGWPNLSMGHFTRIADIPDEIRETMIGVAGGVYQR
ncbi:hypothetical protein TPL01_03310 [Sulfuriferula plumbiphila]|uniref:Lipoprotein n=1 Tax=Sulfuriferula plumbiphila TaxID=171865 RepID=A0A512L3Z3_9PROT|nr:hypothetical protein [Sulfuriferula plumbiphila]BBP05510.1 hypothetical protein SFPGR_29320 [Sulfuriferula plumbiphila]GEP29193.1 hypothetical protein TPL01_03310 [Sulfuriferula plumbiphila]